MKVKEIKQIFILNTLDYIFIKKNKLNLFFHCLIFNLYFKKIKLFSSAYI